MHPRLFTTPFVFLVSLSTTTAQTNETIFSNYTILQSAPFNLVVHSHNRTLNGSLLGACHDGAAREALCAISTEQVGSWGGSTSGSFVYKLNTTVYSCYWGNGTVVPDCGTPSEALNMPAGYAGLIVWDMPYITYPNITGTVSQSLYLEPQGASSNLAFAILSFPSPYLQFFLAFDNSNRLNFQDNLDPERSVQSLDIPKPHYRWAICRTMITSYWGEHLVWVYGNGEPSNRECEMVEVERVFV